MPRNIYSRLAHKHSGGGRRKGGQAEFKEPSPKEQKEASFAERLVAYKENDSQPNIEQMPEPIPEVIAVPEKPKEPSFIERLFSKEPEPKVEVIPEPIVQAISEPKVEVIPEQISEPLPEKLKEPSFIERLFSKEPEPKVETQPMVQPKEQPMPDVPPVLLAPVVVSKRGVGFYLLFSVLILLGLGFIGAGLYLLLKPSETAEATITIVNCQTKPCALTVNFTTKTGMAISGTRTVIGSYTEGQKIKVQYNPDSPSQFTIAKLSSKSFGTIWLSLGLFLLVVAVIYYLMTR